MLSGLEDTVWLVSIYFKCKHKRRSIAIGLFFISCGNASIFFPSPAQPFNHIALTISDLVKPGRLIRVLPGSIFSVGHERLTPTSSKLFLDGLILIGLAANSDRIPLGFHLAGFVLLAWVMTTVMG